MFSRKPLPLRAVFPHRTGQVRYERFCGICRQRAWEQGAVLELRVAKEDLGKVIGKQGRTARALRTLLGAASSKAHRRVMLEIVE